MNMTYGQWLKHERARLGLTQRDIEQRTGISASHVSKIERDTIRRPDDETRASIHRVLETTDADLADAGVMVAVTYRDGTTRHQWPENGIIPAAQLPTQRPVTSGDAAFYEALGEYLPALGESQRRHLIETARLMAGAAVTRGSIPAASLGPASEATEPVPDRPSESSSPASREPGSGR